MNAKNSSPAYRKVNFTTTIIMVVILLTLQVPSVFGDTADYFYDDLGRLSRVVKGTSGVVYSYDDLGNQLSVTSSSTANATPVISAISPNVLFVGSTMLVTITGQNLLTTDSVVSLGGLVTVGNVTVIDDTKIMAEMTPLSAGSETIRVTTRYGSPNTANTSVTLSSATLAFSPSQIALTPGSSGTITASISPPLAVPVTINLESSATSVATVPASLTIPISGSASFVVNALQNGVAEITGGGPKSVVFVGPTFTGDVTGLKSGSISVVIDAPASTSPTVAAPISVSMDAPSGTSPTTTKSVSVYIDSPAGTSPTTASLVSVTVEAPAGDSPSVTTPVSVYVAAPAGESPTVAGNVSVKIQ